MTKQAIEQQNSNKIEQGKLQLKVETTRLKLSKLIYAADALNLKSMRTGGIIKKV